MRSLAIVSTPLTSDLVLVMDNGASASGQSLSQNRTYKNVKVTATDADVYAVGQVLIGLQSKTANAIQRKNTAELESE